MSALTITPAKIRQFGPGHDATFCLLTDEALVDEIELVESGDYDGYVTAVMKTDKEDVLDIVASRVPGRAHVLVISPSHFFVSPDDACLGPDRKLLAMACNSTPTGLREVQHFLRCIERTDPLLQEALAERFFGLAEAGETLEYRDFQRDTSATLRLFDQDLVWNQQAGTLDWGEQQILPAGEISVLPIEITEFDESVSLPLDGEITIRGYPILHSGEGSFTRRDQARIHAELWPMTEHALLARVEEGEIVDLVAEDAGGKGPEAMLNAMFSVDSRYRKVWEIGHGVNTNHDILLGNHAMNEVYGGTSGCLHWGLGLTPYTQFHLDIVAPGTVVINQLGEAMLGAIGEPAPERTVMVSCTG